MLQKDSFNKMCSKCNIILPSVLCMMNNVEQIKSSAQGILKLITVLQK